MEPFYAAQSCENELRQAEAHFNSKHIGSKTPLAPKRPALAKFISFNYQKVNLIGKLIYDARKIKRSDGMR